MGKRITKYRLELVKESSKVYEVESRISSPRDVSEYIEQVFKLSIQAEEVMVMLVLDTKNNVIGAFEVSRGSLNASIVHPREIFKRALLLNAASIILAHNHPACSLKPSESDINLTKNIKKSLEVFDISILDHIILNDNCSYYSLADNFDLNF